MQKLWEVQPQGLVLVLHLGQVQLCNCNNLKVAESTNWINRNILEMRLFIGLFITLFFVNVGLVEANTKERVPKISLIMYYEMLLYATAYL